MATVGRLLCLVGIVLCSCIVTVSGDKIRAVLRAIRNCPKIKPTNMPVEFTFFKITYSNRGRFFHVNATIWIKRHISFRKGFGDIGVYRDGATPLKIAGYHENDACDLVMHDIKLAEPLFAPGAFPRKCEFEPQNYTGHFSYDLHLNIPGGIFRGDFMVEDAWYDDDGKLLICVREHFRVTKDTLN